MKRKVTVYLDEAVWTALRDRAIRENTTVSRLIGTATRERYMSTPKKLRVDRMAAAPESPGP
jgi:predicted DNA-binding ribbon-helix-helix protein